MKGKQSGEAAGTDSEKLRVCAQKFASTSTGWKVPLEVFVVVVVKKIELNFADFAQIKNEDSSVLPFGELPDTHNPR